MAKCAPRSAKDAGAVPGIAQSFAEGMKHLRSHPNCVKHCCSPDWNDHELLEVDRVVCAAASNVRHAATLRNIPAQIGTTFGFRYEVMCKPHAAPVELRQVVIFPSPGLTPSFSSSSRSIIQDEFLLQTRIGETSYAFYTLEDAFELVPGSWVFEIWQGNRRLAMQVFKVITSIPDDGKVITSTADVSVITSTADCEAGEGF
jgi:hypothetical protein